MYALAATDHGFLSGGGKDNTVKIWNWSYEVSTQRSSIQLIMVQLFPVQAGESNHADIQAGVRTIAPAQTPDGLSLSQFMVGTLDNGIVAVDASDGSVAPVVFGHFGRYRWLVLFLILDKGM